MLLLKSTFMVVNSNENFYFPDIIDILLKCIALQSLLIPEGKHNRNIFKICFLDFTQI